MLGSIERRELCASNFVFTTAQYCNRETEREKKEYKNGSRPKGKMFHSNEFPRSFHPDKKIERCLFWAANDRWPTNSDGESDVNTVHINERLCLCYCETKLTENYTNLVRGEGVRRSRYSELEIGKMHFL